MAETPARPGAEDRRFGEAGNKGVAIRKFLLGWALAGLMLGPWSGPARPATAREGASFDFAPIAIQGTWAIADIRVSTIASQGFDNVKSFLGGRIRIAADRIDFLGHACRLRGATIKEYRWGVDEEGFYHYGKDIIENGLPGVLRGHRPDEGSLKVLKMFCIYFSSFTSDSAIAASG